MDEPMRDTPAPTRTQYGYCSWHRRFAHGVRLVQLDDAGSGPAGRSLVPLADR
jgi:hypothetical protein